MSQPEYLCQIEIPVADLDRSQLFYQEVMGWQVVPVTIDSCVIFQVPEECAYGVMLIKRASTPDQSLDACESYERAAASGLCLYFACDNPRQALRNVVAFGGRVLTGALKRPGYGLTWQFTDPDGHRLGLFQRGVV